MRIKTNYDEIYIIQEIKMLEIIKNKIWELLKDKEVSLVMIFHRDGDILWHRGREIKGKSIEKGLVTPHFFMLLSPTIGYQMLIS